MTSLPKPADSPRAPAGRPARLNLILVIASDPRSSPRPAEAVRIAAGIAALNKVQVTLFLVGPAVLILSEETGDLENDESYRLHLPILRDHRCPVYVEPDTPEWAAMGPPTVPVRTINRAELARIAADAHALACF